ncbi:hypothetical protein BDR06DRAFT_972639 [Suillus hirtellus]|nr:hypothetical protein BDR06DRAFT_972639 [Suillus hirtellus]
MAACNAIKLELPMDVKTFKFTFECRTPGPVMLSPQAGTVKGPNISSIHTEVPGALGNWLGAVEAGPPVVDDSVTEPESELAAEDLKHTSAQALVSTGPLVDDSKTEPESELETKDEPATPAEFYHWYNTGNFKHVSERIILGACKDAGPILQGFTVPLHETPASISLNIEFYDFPLDLDDALLDTGFLEPEDLGFGKPGDPLPYLGHNIWSPETLLAAIDHFDRYNAATAAGSCPLTPHDAHNLPPDQEEHELQYQLQQAIKHAEENSDLDQDLDPDANPLEDVDEYQDILGKAQPAEDDPNPFFIADGLCAEDTTNIIHLPGHLVLIYTVVSWLHLQFHLPKVACNALLAIFTCILLTLSPNIKPPFVTLQSSNHVLDIDKPIYTLSICPLCHNMFPPACSPHSHNQCTLCNEDLFLPDKTAHSNQHSLKSPLIKYPYLPLSNQIKSLLKVLGLESLLDYCVCKTKLKAPDASPDGELHISVNLGVNCAITFIVSNFLFHLQTSTRILYSPWPQGTESRPDPTVSPPNRFRPPLIMERWHQMCWINIANKDKPSAFTDRAFKAWTNKEHCELGEQYRNLTTANARKNFVKEFATRYMQLSRLPYFNIVEQVIIDPMHNLFLSLVKTHFYNIWVQSKILRPTHELQMLHKMLANYGHIKFIVPGSCGQLPTDIGMPSGGSLTADQWLLLATAYGPIIKLENKKEANATRKLDDRNALAEAKKCGKEAFEAEKARIARDKVAAAKAKTQEKLQLTAIKQAEKVQLAAEKKAKAVQRKGKQKATEQNVEGLPEAQFLNQEPGNGDSEPTNIKFSLHPDDPANFLKLSAALRISIKHQICDRELDHADCLLHEYCSELTNLNKVLKSFKTNNHANGELETTFFTEFQRMCHIGWMTFSLLNHSKTSLPCTIAEIMLKASNEE